MIRCLAEGTAVEPTAGSLRHDTIVTRFKEFLEANPDRPLYLTEICAAIGVAERTLRASCEEHLGMGPIRYLALRRMHLVRRTLLGSDPSKATVTKIVTDHGFWELGRFSVAYRLLFGESPSCTLQRRSEQSEVRPNRPSSLAATRLQAAEPNTEGWPEIRWAKVLEFADPLPCQAAVQGADVEMRPTTREVFTRKSRRQG
jgi:AraC-like DNA-binding protein